MIDSSRLLCALGGHRAEPGIAWNQGYAFSRCRRCEREIIRSLFGRWRLPPRGFRIAWRPADAPADPHKAVPGATRSGRGPLPIGDFMDADGPDFRWTDDFSPDDRDPSGESDDFMRDEPRPSPRVRGRR